MKNIKINFVFSFSMVFSLLLTFLSITAAKAQEPNSGLIPINKAKPDSRIVFETYKSISRSGDTVVIHFEENNKGFCTKINSNAESMINFRTLLRDDTITLVNSDKTLYRLILRIDKSLRPLYWGNSSFQPDRSSANVILASNSSQPIEKSAINSPIKTPPTKPQPIAEFETLITRGQKPMAPGIYSKYDPEQRVIQWRESLIKNYMYSDEVFDKLGYNKLMWNTDEGGGGETYRNCSKGIIVEVRNYEGELSITMTWYPRNIRDGIGYLMNCP